MNFLLSDLYLASPDIVILTMTCFLLLLDVFVKPNYRVLIYYFAQATLIAAFIAALPEFGEFSQSKLIFDGHYIIDKLAILSKLFIYFFSFFAFAYTKKYLEDHGIARSDYYLLSLLAVLGLSIMVSAFSFLSIYLGLELSSLSLYTLVALDKKSRLATEAALKYFILGSLASGIFLYGISLFYGITGSIQLNMVAHVLEPQMILSGASSPFAAIAIVALVFLMGGLIFKFGAVPFHMWVPDVYQGASTPTTLFIASAPKIAIFAVTLRILVQALPSLQVNWQHILIAISILSMFFGNILAIAQSNLKRMLAYSSIAHIGYTLLGIIAGPYASQGYSAAMFYLATYVLVAVGAFAIITLLSRDGMEFDSLNDYRGLNVRSPWLAFMMLLLLFSMAGVPPTVGFIAKLGLLEALVQADLVWLAVLALIFALIGAYYYLRVVMLMYFEEPEDKTEVSSISLSPNMQIAISLNGALALLLGLLPSFFIDLCRISVG